MALSGAQWRSVALSGAQWHSVSTVGSAQGLSYHYYHYYDCGSDTTRAGPALSRSLSSSLSLSLSLSFSLLPFGPRPNFDGSQRSIGARCTFEWPYG